jgi:tryptophanyl-tRNA synthetase
MNAPEKLEALMQQGAQRARAIAAPFLAELRAAVGLRPFQPVAAAATAATQKAALPVFKQYREADGRFYFKLTAHDGTLLLQSQGFEQGREAGQWVGKLKAEGAAALAQAPVSLGDGVTADEVGAALAALA